MLSKPENCCGLKESEVLSLLHDVGNVSHLGSYPFTLCVMVYFILLSPDLCVWDRLWNSVSPREQDYSPGLKTWKYRSPGNRWKGSDILWILFVLLLLFKMCSYWVFVCLAGPQDNRLGLCQRFGSRKPLHIVCRHTAVSGISFTYFIMLWIWFGLYLTIILHNNLFPVVLIYFIYAPCSVSAIYFCSNCHFTQFKNHLCSS